MDFSNTSFSPFSSTSSSISSPAGSRESHEYEIKRAHDDRSQSKHSVRHGLTSSSSASMKPSLTLVSAEKKPQNTPTAPSELSEAQLKRICHTFSLALTSTPQECFNAAYEACQKHEWTLINPIQDDLDHLVNEQGRTLLLEALYQTDVALGIELIKHKITVLKTDREGNSALHYAARLGDVQLVKMCWEHLYINAPNLAGWTPLHQAVEVGSLQTISDLLANGADINAKAIYRQGEATFQVTPFELAIIKGYRHCIGPMLAYSPDPNSQVTGIGNPLHLAIHFHQCRLFEDLLTVHYDKTKPFIDATDNDLKTPCMLAAELGEASAIVLLQAKGAQLDKKDRKGRTAFHWAALGRQKLTIDLLYYYGCKVDELVDRKPPDQLIASSPDKLSQDLANHIINLSHQRERLEKLPQLFALQLPENLVFKGGGPKGFAYLGAYRELHERGVLREVRRVAGTSAGAITATLIALGYTPAELETVMTETDFNSFLDHPFKFEGPMDAVITSISAVVRKIVDIVERPIDNIFTILGLWNVTSICSGEVFRKWIENLIFKKTGIRHCTFGELKALADKGGLFKQLYIYTCNLSTGEPTLMDSETDKWKDVVISDAVRATMSIPGAFEPHILHTKDAAGNRIPLKHLGAHVDGGLVCNFPIGIFDKRKYLPVSSDKEEAEKHVINRRTLGFSLYSPVTEPIQPDKKAESIGELLMSVFAIYRRAGGFHGDRIYDNQLRTIRINDQGVGLLEFGLSKEKQQRLIASGQTATRTFWDEQEQLTSAEASLFVHSRITLEARGILSLRTRYDYFTGREEYLKELEERIFNKKKKLVVLSGEPGLGKTETAISFANRHLDKFSLVWLIPSDTDEKMKEAYLALAKELGISCEDKDSLTNIRNRVHANLETTPRPKPFLLVFDNVEKDIPLPTRGGKGAILMTSRQNRFWKTTKVLQMKNFSKEEAVDTFSKIVRKPVEKTIVEAIVDKLSYFPLAITQAAFYVARTPGMTVEKYLEFLTQHEGTVIRVELADGRYPLSFIEAWRITEATLKSDSPLAYEWLNICSCLDPDRIPISWIDNWLKEKEPDAAQRFIKRDQVLFTLKNYGLISYDEESSTLSIHHLRQRMIHSSLNADEQAQVASQATSFIADFGSNLSVKKFEDWNDFVTWEPHALKILGLTKRGTIQEGRIYLRLSEWEEEKGEYSKALDYAKKAEEIFRNQSKGQTSKDLADSLKNLGWVLLELGDSQRAMKYLEEALAMRREIYQDTPNHREIAGSLNSLGAALQVSGDLQGAKEYYEKALEMLLTIYQATDTLYHRDIAVSLCNLGMICGELGNWLEAEEYFESALEIQKVFHKATPNHPDIAGSLSNLGLVLQNLVDLRGARRNLIDAVAMYRVVYKATPHHRVIANSLIHLGEILQALGDLQGAQKNYKEALAIYKVVHKANPNHPSIARSLDSLGEVLRKLGDLQEAKRNYEDALAMFRVVHKATPNHLEIANALNNLGQVLQAQGDLKEAKKKYEDALAMYRVLHQATPNHPDIAKSLNNLGLVLRDLGDLEGAKKYFENALFMYREVLKAIPMHYLAMPTHLEIANSLYNLGMVLQALGDLKGARGKYEEALNIRKYELREKDDHPNFLKVKRNLESLNRQCVIL